MGDLVPVLELSEKTLHDQRHQTKVWHKWHKFSRVGSQMVLPLHGNAVWLPLISWLQHKAVFRLTTALCQETQSPHSFQWGHCIGTARDEQQVEPSSTFAIGSAWLKFCRNHLTKHCAWKLDFKKWNKNQIQAPSNFSGRLFMWSRLLPDLRIAIHIFCLFSNWNRSGDEPTDGCFTPAGRNNWPIRV